MFKEKRNVIKSFHTKHEMEPYSVIRRSKVVPLFHPYYINYGFNKVEMFSRLTYLSGHFLFIQTHRIPLLCTSQWVLCRYSSQQNQNIGELQAKERKHKCGGKLHVKVTSFCLFYLWSNHKEIEVIRKVFLLQSIEMLNRITKKRMQM